MVISRLFSTDDGRHTSVRESLESDPGASSRHRWSAGALILKASDATRSPLSHPPVKEGPEVWYIKFQHHSVSSASTAWSMREASIPPRWYQSSAAWVQAMILFTRAWIGVPDMPVAHAYVGSRSTRFVVDLRGSDVMVVVKRRPPSYTTSPLYGIIESVKVWSTLRFDKALRDDHLSWARGVVPLEVPLQDDPVLAHAKDYIWRVLTNALGAQMPLLDDPQPGNDYAEQESE